LEELWNGNLHIDQLLLTSGDIARRSISLRLLKAKGDVFSNEETSKGKSEHIA
jgi:hypothetical protein